MRTTTHILIALAAIIAAAQLFSGSYIGFAAFALIADALYRTRKEEKA